ncbi:hypothetical protein [Methylocella tundrae]|uniref:Uncharacterized protein n=1 Tax=Methylocella tundrae TaxID=227605 RepID=A0A4U8YX66_METTU|nr:hypothetical protein [Methylocella tundrae]WPP05486.1 hypothetical protein SIN04_06590 [Methylocella tundrae]VFU07909.1 protein of unknown function [Methylocella tundrae]
MSIFEQPDLADVDHAVDALWRCRFDTATIARLLNRSEAQIYNRLCRRAGMAAHPDPAEFSQFVEGGVYAAD